MIVAYKNLSIREDFTFFSQCQTKQNGFNETSCAVFVDFDEYSICKIDSFHTEKEKIKGVDRKTTEKQCLN